MKALVVEDQERLGRFVQQGLTECRYTVTWVRTCASRERCIQSHAPQAVAQGQGAATRSGPAVRTSSS